MIDQSVSAGDFWCPLSEKGNPATAGSTLDLSASESAALFRFNSGDWISDANIERLAELGLIERVFGQALLTRLGRVTLGIDE